MARTSQSNKPCTDEDSPKFDYDKNYSSYPTITPHSDLYFETTLSYHSELLSETALNAIAEGVHKTQKELKSQFREEYKRGLYYGSDQGKFQIATFAFRMKDFNNDIKKLLAPVIEDIKKIGILNFIKNHPENALEEIAKRAFLPGYDEQAPALSLKDRIKVALSIIDKENIQRSCLNLFKKSSAYFDFYLDVNKIEDVNAPQIQNNSALETIHRHLKIYVARELGLLSDRQATVMLGITDPLKQEKETNGIAVELAAAVSILTRAADVGVLKSETANSEFEKIFKSKALDVIRFKLREIDGLAELPSKLDFSATENDWQEWDHLAATVKVAKT